MLHYYVSFSMVTMVVTELHWSEREGGRKILKSGKINLNASRLEEASMPFCVVFRQESWLSRDRGLPIIFPWLNHVFCNKGLDTTDYMNRLPLLPDASF